MISQHNDRKEKKDKKYGFAHWPHFCNLTLDKLQLSHLELPSWCVTQPHLARAVSYDIFTLTPTDHPTDTHDKKTLNLVSLQSSCACWPLKVPPACSCQLRGIELTATKSSVFAQRSGQINAPAEV